jgi:predicted metal-dependent peptidase
MKVFSSFDDLYRECVILCENSVSSNPWPSAPPSDPAVKSQLLKDIKHKIEKARFQIATRDLPTVGVFLQNLKTILTFDVKTMAVDDKGNVYVNPTFANFLSFQEVKGVLIHEAMHVFTGTFERKRDRKHKLWNICTDYLMNFYIMKDATARAVNSELPFTLPKGGCIPEPNGDVYFDVDGKRHTFNVTGKTAEWLYAQLEKIMPPPPPDKGKPGEPGEPGEGEGEPDDGEPGESGEAEGDPTPVDKNGNPLSATDDDEAPVDPTLEEGSKKPNTKPKTRREIQDDIRTAIRTVKQKEHIGQQQRGTGEGSGLEDIMVDATASRTNYKELLKNLAHNIDARFNWRRSSRRGYAVGSWIPKMETDIRLARIAIAIDTSGSMGDREIQQIIGECIKIGQQFPGVTLDIIKWDTGVYYYQPVTKGVDVKKVISSHIRRGGTHMSSVAEYYEKNKDIKHPAAVLYFTDGCVEDGPKLLPTPTKNFFLIIPGGSDRTLKKDKRGTTFNIQV